MNKKKKTQPKSESEQLNSSRLEDIENRLNDRNYRPDIKTERPAVGGEINELAQLTQDVPKDWIDDDLVRKNEAVRPKQKLSLLNKLLLIMSGVFVITLAVAVYFWTQDFQAIDPDKIIFEVNHPTRINAGEALNFNVAISNTNPNPLVNAKLLTRFGAGAVTDQGEPRLEIDLGNLGPAETQRLQIPVVLTGMVNEERVLDFELTYGIPDSEATFSKAHQETLTIDYSPIALRIISESELIIGKNQEFTIRIDSTATQQLDDITLELDIAGNLQLTGTTPSLDNGSRHLIDNLSPGERFSLDGQVLSTASRSSTGTIRATLFNNNGILLAVSEFNINIVEPPLALRLAPMGDPVPSRSTAIRISLTNNSDSVIEDISVTGQVDNSFVENLNISNGTYNQSSGELVLNSNTWNNLSRLTPGQSAETSFSFTPLRGGTLSIDFVAVGRQLSLGSLQRELYVGIENITITEPLRIEGYAVYRSGPETNQGPLPPVVGRDTTYTIIWSADLGPGLDRLAEIKATLPENVTIFGDLPQNMEYRSGTVRWLSPTSGQTRRFQVSLRPTTNQIGQSAALLEQFEATTTNLIEGESYFSLPDITTDINRDISYDLDETIVQSN